MSFDAFTDRSPVEPLRDAVVAAILADVELAAWTDGRIVAVPDPVVEPDSVLPVIQVYGDTEFLEHRVGSGEVETQATCGIAVYYDDVRLELQPGATSIATPLWRILVALHQDPTLGGVAKRIVSIGRFDYARRLDSEGGWSSEASAVVDVTYSITYDQTTGEAT